jgi:hypothetical protein
MSIKTIILIVVHLVCAIVLAACISSGPPMGESEIHPWDTVFLLSGLATVIIFPFLWLKLAVQRIWTRK